VAVARRRASCRVIAVVVTRTFAGAGGGWLSFASESFVLYIDD
jgi:hypothetical protein